MLFRRWFSSSRTAVKGSDRGKNQNVLSPIIKPLSRHVGLDVGSPQLWYRAARQLKRRIHLHIGPTNSGKTYQALEALMQQPGGGIYCGPLRLLAWEVCEKIRAKGLLCSLVTGQEIDMQGDEPAGVAAHKSCTIEMVDLKSRFKTAVIDEGQLLGDKSRGWAWTQAYLGLQAMEIHVCGSENLVEIVEKLAVLCGDEIVARNVYERLSPLSVGTRAVENYSNIEPGDCVVGFQRSRLYEIKGLVERHNPALRCCVVYGGLPPETRREQAALFGDPLSGFQVLVASDAIGMGLNLAIRRVIFSSITKFDGRTRRTLTPAEIRQIAGRAGRYNVPGNLPALNDGNGREDVVGGIATCMAADDLAVIRRGLDTSLPRVKRAGLFPSLEQLELLGVFVDFHISKELLADFWIDRMRREWGGEGEESDGEAMRDIISQRILDCSSCQAVVDYFGSISEFSHALELFIYDHRDKEERAAEGERERGGETESEESKRRRLQRRVKRIDRLRRQSRGIKSDDDLNVRAPMGATLSQLLEIFKEVSAVDSGGVFFLCDLDERLNIASLLDDIPALSFRDRYIISMAPVNCDDEELKIYFRRFANDKASSVGVALLDDLAHGAQEWRLPSSPGELLRMETRHKVLELYLWLAQRFPANFPQVKQAREQAEHTSRLISQALVTLGQMQVDKRVQAQAGRRRAEAGRSKTERHKKKRTKRARRS